MSDDNNAVALWDFERNEEMSFLYIWRNLALLIQIGIKSVTHVFGKLLQGRLMDDELSGLREDRRESVRYHAKFLAEFDGPDLDSERGLARAARPGHNHRGKMSGPRPARCTPLS